MTPPRIFRPRELRAERFTISLDPAPEGYSATVRLVDERLKVAVGAIDSENPFAIVTLRKLNIELRGRGLFAQRIAICVRDNQSKLDMSTDIHRVAIETLLEWFAAYPVQLTCYRDFIFRVGHEAGVQATQAALKELIGL
jgi:hypothetical protein